MRAAIYARSATDNPDALRRQEERCRTHAAEHGWTIAGIWTEVGSGLAANLPGLAGLVDAGEAGAVDVVLATSPERISRDPRRMQAVVERLGNAGVAVAWADGAGLAEEVLAAVARWRGTRGER